MTVGLTQDRELIAQLTAICQELLDYVRQDRDCLVDSCTVAGDRKTADEDDQAMLDEVDDLIDRAEQVLDPQ